MNEIIKKNGITFGIITGVISILITASVYIIDLKLFTAWWLGILSIGIYLGIGIYLLSKTKKELGGIFPFKDAFTKAAGTRFGSGWAWLIQRPDGSLSITSTPNQDSPLMQGIADECGKPIIGLDVWEHAYYLNYQNRRPDYIKAFWNIVDWERADSLFS